MVIHNTPKTAMFVGYNDDPELFTKAYNILVAHYGTNCNETEHGFVITAKKCDVVALTNGKEVNDFRSITHHGDGWEVVCVNVNAKGHTRTIMMYLGITQQDFDMFVRRCIITEEAFVLERLAIAKAERIASSIRDKIAVPGWGLVHLTDCHLCIANGNRKIEVKLIDGTKQLFCHAMTVERFLVDY